MHYFDRCGVSITPATWGALYRNPAYAIVRRDEHDGFAVETSWVGTAPAGRTHLLFLVRSFAIGKRTRERGPQSIEEVWCETEAEALERHGRLLTEIKEVLSA